MKPSQDLCNKATPRWQGYLATGSDAMRSTGYDTFYTDDEAQDETEANAFAAGLLMPISLFEKAAIEQRLSDAKLAKLFWVSEEAVVKRKEDMWRRRL